MNPIKGADNDIPSVISTNTDDYEAITVDETTIISCNTNDDPNELGKEKSSLRETESCKKGQSIDIDEESGAIEPLTPPKSRKLLRSQTKSGSEKNLSLIPDYRRDESQVQGRAQTVSKAKKMRREKRKCGTQVYNPRLMLCWKRHFDKNWSRNDREAADDTKLDNIFHPSAPTSIYFLNLTHTLVSDLVSFIDVICENSSLITKNTIDIILKFIFCVNTPTLDNKKREYDP
ncbi:unnamed protein product [Lepeophtheirus salmonis]|uniref:(salmon louse) hypothetical protein n=1 Tax=Lepeophtheirus salmonis TaxID=72036 RepID=A0A7R8HFM9_LEPSM|nr:unnamed protein product [Lepeophtheirus salmonis]CAF3047401.1 unnamed protein product [Lepeophtheirus salmonis]